MSVLPDRLSPTVRRIVVALYGVWALAVVAFVSFQVIGSPVPPVVRVTVVAGALLAAVVGAALYARDGVDYLTG